MKKLKENPNKKTLYMREYRNKNKDKFKEYNKRYMGKYMTKEKKEIAVKNARKWYLENKDLIEQQIHDKYIAKRYGITHERYKELIKEQNGVCAICHKICITGDRLSIDHNHKTGEVRGLLCKKCNLGIGYFEDSVELVDSAFQYLIKYYK